jgi:hypothetical protein
MGHSSSLPAVGVVVVVVFHHHLLLVIVVIVIMIIRGGQLVATERADGVAMEPLEDAVLVEDVGAGHGPERRRSCHRLRLYMSCCCVLLLLIRTRIAQSLEADGTVVVRGDGGEEHLLEPQDGLVGGGDASTLVAASRSSSSMWRWRWGWGSRMLERDGRRPVIMVMRVPAAVTTTVTIMRINIGGQGQRYGILLHILRGFLMPTEAARVRRPVEVLLE